MRIRLYPIALFVPFFIALLLCLGARADSPVSALAQQRDSQAPVDLEADSLKNDEASQTVTAEGNVILVQSGRILKADSVSYALSTDTVRAQGNVVLSEPTGETYFADELELTDEMKDGFARGVRGILTDGGRFWADDGQRIGGTKLVMNSARYTPCEPCTENPDAPPVWQLVASKVTHDDEDKRIIYNNARLEFWGVPVLYTPYFSHPDGSVEQKSGFLVPRFGFDSELGATYQQEYYWAIAPDKDATVGALIASDENPLLLGQYRQRFDNAVIDLGGGITVSDRITTDDEENDELRGHVEASGLWDINNTWRAGFDSEWASDDQYFRQYDISTEDVLENRVYAERFSGRDYAVVQALAFQDIRTSNRQDDQPAILPEIRASFLGEPNKTLGGRWSADFSALGLYRDGNDQDLVRGSGQVGWQRRFVDDIGLVTVADVSARGDVYQIGDRDVADVDLDRSNDSRALRGFVQGQVQTSYPLVNRFNASQIVVEPIAALTVGSNVNVNGDIPNEDSEDTVIDALNLFEANRFSGFDRIEDRSRVTYGLRNGFYTDDGLRLEVFAGQSQRFDSGDNPFPDGTGLEEDASDYVGQISADLGSYLDVDYRFQLDDHSFASRRHEVDAAGQIGRLGWTGRYFYGVGLEGTEVEETREQVIGTGSFRLSDQWSVNGSLRYDFGVEEGLRQASYGLTYSGQCVSVSGIASRTLTTDSSGDSGTEIFLRIGLKNLGEFSASGINVTSSSDDDNNNQDSTAPPAESP